VIDRKRQANSLLRGSEQASTTKDSLRTRGHGCKPKILYTQEMIRYTEEAASQGLLAQKQKQGFCFCRKGHSHRSKSRVNRTEASK
jgi:hypothetical protein